MEPIDINKAQLEQLGRVGIKMSKEISLSRGLKAIVDNDDYDMLLGKEWYAQKDTKGKLYAATTIMGDVEYMHRMITNAKDDEVVDHKNNNTLDNRKENLIISTSQENAMNKDKTKHDTSSKYKGVTKVDDKWKAHIGIDDKDIHIGYFDTEEEAARAYDAKAKELFNDRANLNIL